MPKVEVATGLEFLEEPGIAIRSREQVRNYLLNRLSTTIPPDELAGFQTSYRLFGLLPDTLELNDLLIRLYTEQVVGYYDPDSTTLYVVDRSDPLQVSLVLAHELVHALQDQYTDVDSLLSILRESDRAAAAQAVLEGQATLASIKVMLPETDISQFSGFWEQARQTVAQNQQSMPVFASAPRVIRESALFPYLGGADFMSWFELEYPDTVPFGRLMPQSTEQILHPERFPSDEPATLRFLDSTDPIYTDVLGELGVRILVTELSGNEARGVAVATGWDGDRFALFEDGGEFGLVWWSVWDDERAARRFALTIEREWRARETGRPFSVRQMSLGERPAVVLVDTPMGWNVWDAVPEVAVGR